VLTFTSPCCALCSRLQVIRIDAPMLRGMGETVNISFSGMSSRYPGSQDWIGVWSPRPVDGNYSAVSPSKYKYVTPDSAGSGHVELWLLNMRQSVVVAYFSGGLQTPVLLAESQPVKFDNIALPMHIHLALTGDPTQMRIDWTSAQDGASEPWLRWGDRPNNLSSTVKQVSSAHSHGIQSVRSTRLVDGC
jgi:Fn3-like domain from Purple Acid Phosphatase/Purple acid Phosphatase, N-terminal domain